MNNLFNYSANTNMTINGKKTMLTYLLGFKQFSQGVNENPI